MRKTVRRLENGQYAIQGWTMRDGEPFVLLTPIITVPDIIPVDVRISFTFFGCQFPKFIADIEECERNDTDYLFPAFLRVTNNSLADQATLAEIVEE